MSDALKKALTEAVRINMIKEGYKGGTYAQFIIRENLIPVQLTERWQIDESDWILRDVKKQWGVQWVQIRERHESEKGATRTVGIIHNLVPFEFMRKMMGIVPKTVYYSRPIFNGEFGGRCMFSRSIVELGRFHFCQAEGRLCKSNGSARKALAIDLAQLRTSSEEGKILENNRRLVREKLSTMEEYRDRLERVVTVFLQQYYMQRIGEAVCFSELPWEKITITEEFLNT